MLSEQQIMQAVRRVVAAARAPLKVILFGSYGRGEARESSDLDLIVVERGTPDAGEEMIRLQDALGDIGADVDLLVYSESDFEKRSNWCSTPVYWAVREGRVLYEHRE
jgi:predicted nucleotidyltransferase